MTMEGQEMMQPIGEVEQSNSGILTKAITDGMVWIS
jgi:hypothetical protein